MGALFLLCCIAACIGGTIMHFHFDRGAQAQERALLLDEIELMRCASLALLGLIIALAGFIGAIAYMAVSW